MRDAFGGAFMIKLFLVFIFIYICFTALALNYAKAFKVKNMIIDYIENNEITDICKMNAKELMTMETFFETELIGKKGYSIKEHQPCQNEGYIHDEEGRCTGYCHPSGIKIQKKGDAQNTEGIYYTVSTYMGWSVPFLSKLSALNGNNQEQETVSGTWEISGETRVVISK